MASLHIIPKYRLLLTYDIRPNMQESYYRYVMREFVPQVQDLGLYMVEAWHTAYGDYPLRRIEFVTEHADIATRVFEDSRWLELENKLKTYITNYSRKLVTFRNGYQI